MRGHQFFGGGSSRPDLSLARGSRRFVSEIPASGSGCSESEGIRRRGRQVVVHSAGRSRWEPPSAVADVEAGLLEAAASAVSRKRAFRAPPSRDSQTPRRWIVAVSMIGGDGESDGCGWVFDDDRRFPHGDACRCAWVWRQWVSVWVRGETSEGFPSRKLKKPGNRSLLSACGWFAGRMHVGTRDSRHVFYHYR